MRRTDTARSLTGGEIALARSIFGDAIDYAGVCINRHAWWPFQPRNTIMAPDGHLWLHPHGDLWCEDFAGQRLSLQALFVHEMTHVWQAARGGRWWLPLMRHPFCRYAYDLVPGRPFTRYGIEQQAEIVRHAFLLRHGVAVPGKPGLTEFEALLPFRPG